MMKMQAGPGSFQARLFWAFALVTAIAAVLPALFFRNALYEDRLGLAGKQALAQASFARSMLESNPDEDQIRRLFQSVAELSFRMTLTDASGRVLMDSHIGREALPELDNHGDRPEIEDALAKGSGISLRHSNSLGIDAVYAAVALKDGGTLRVAVPLAEVRQGFDRELLFMGAAVAGVALFCLILSAVITGRMRRAMDGMAEVVASIARDKSFRRLREVPGREFLPLAYAVNHMADTIEEYVRTTSDQQSQLETILDSMHEGVLVLGPSGAIRRWNKALARLFPAVAASEGKPLIEGIPLPALQRRVDALLARAGASLTPADGEALHCEQPAGRFLVAHVSRPVTPDDAMGAVIVVYDATEIMRLETVRRDFVSNVSHELRTPLTAITGYAETLMVSDDLDEEYRRFAAIIHKHAAALSGIISDLLTLARMEDARETIALTPLDAREILADVITACRDAAEAKRVTVAMDMDGPDVLANGPLLAQVFRNLLENALRYSPDGGTVHVSSRARENGVLFTVADSGPGIPPEDLPRIFERFYQVRKERNSGTAGIGLAICKHSIERHNGRIWAESPYEEASTAMLFTLPTAAGRPDQP